MAWVRVDDAFYDHPKFHDVNALGVALWVTSLAWANRNLTDGFIPRSQAVRLINLDGIDIHHGMAGRPVIADDAIDQLIGCGAWIEVDRGYQIVNYLEFQPSAEKVRADREAARTRMALARTGKPPTGAPSDVVRANNNGTSSEVRVTPNPNPTQEQTPLITPPARSPDFDAFWDLYPRKVGKPKAAKAWAAAIRSVSPEVIIEGAKRLAADPNLPTKQFIPHATTWLTRAGWDDEPYPAPDSGPVAFRPAVVGAKCPEHPHMTTPCASCAAERAAGIRKDYA